MQTERSTGFSFRRSSRRDLRAAAASTPTKFCACTRTSSAIGFFLATLLAGTSAFASDEITGTLRLTWGDPETGSNAPAMFEVMLEDAAGNRIALDADSALRAADDLYRLDGRAVTLTSETMRDGARVAQKITAADAAATEAVTAITGDQPWVNIACKFSDIATEPKTIAYINGMMANQAGRLDHYWREVSYNKITISGSASYGWFTLPNPESFYEPYDDAKRNLLLQHCTAAADATVNFGPFVGINTMYNGNRIGAWGTSGRNLTLDGTTRSWRSTWNAVWAYDDESPIAHEMGHGFGLPHANNSDGDTDDYDNPWDVMSDNWSNAVRDATYDVLGKHISTWSRDKLGWVDAARKLTISADGQYNGITLDRASLLGSTQRQMIVITLPPPAPATQYYTVEARSRVGGYDGNLAGKAVIIHQIDTTRRNPAWSVDAQIPPADRANNAGSMFVVGESWIDPTGAFKVSVVGETPEGFTVDVQRGGALAPDLIFRNGFQP